MEGRVAIRGSARSGDRRRALLLAVAVIGAIALVAGGLVIARTIKGGPGPELLRGTSGDDVIVGRGGADSIRGFGGRDRLAGRRGDDRLHGGGGRDRLLGGRGADVLKGGPGLDALIGGSGPDTLLAGPGGAVLRGGRGYDSFNGSAGVQKGAGNGDDVIWARDGREDFVSCGGGHDVAYVDLAEEGAIGCEELYPR